MAPVQHWIVLMLCLGAVAVLAMAISIVALWFRDGR